VNAKEFNARHKVGTPVAAYPGIRDDFPLITRTRSAAWELGHGAPIVKVEGYAGGIVLTHVDVIDRAAVKEGQPIAEMRLTERNFARIETAIDRAGVFTKDYTQPVDGKLATVGLRIGVKPGHVVAFLGDTVIAHADGTYTVRKAEAGETR
jgi:hypothetical protein